MNGLKVKKNIIKNKQEKDGRDIEAVLLPPVKKNKNITRNIRQRLCPQIRKHTDMVVKGEVNMELIQTNTETLIMSCIMEEDIGKLLIFVIVIMIKDVQKEIIISIMMMTE